MNLATENALLVSSKIMEIVWRYNKSSNGISQREQEDFAWLWSLLSPLGVELLTKWASENNYKLIKE